MSLDADLERIVFYYDFQLGDGFAGLELGLDLFLVFFEHEFGRLDVDVEVVDGLVPLIDDSVLELEFLASVCIHIKLMAGNLN